MLGTSFSEKERVAEDQGARFLELGQQCERDGDLNTALEWYGRAAELPTSAALAHYRRGNVLADLGQWSEAVVAYEDALRYRPDWPECHFNRGNTLLRLGQFSAAEASCSRAVELKTDFFDAWVSLGLSREALGHFGGAIASYCTALTLRPGHVGVNLNLADAYLAAGDREKAVDCLEFVLQAEPGHTRAGALLVAQLRELGRNEASESVCRRALVLNPAHVGLLIELGMTLMRVQRYEESVACFEEVLALEANSIPALHNLGASHHILKNYDSAERAYFRALQCAPENVPILSNYGVLLTEMGRVDAAVEVFDKIMALSSDTRVFAEALSNKLFCRNFCRAPGVENIAIQEARHYGEHVSRMATPYLKWKGLPVADRTLRVGLVSGDLRRHPVVFFLERVLSGLVNRGQGDIEVYAYSSHPLVDEYTERIRKSCAKWFDVSTLAFDELARKIHDDGVDILIDLSGHTSHNRLPAFAWKPAPVQVSWLGYFATTGVPQIDYLIGDPWTLPEGEEQFFTERIWRLPETRLCFSPPQEPIDVVELPALNEGVVTFGCFNSTAKLGDEVLALWSQVLLSVPGSRLMLKSKQMDESSIREQIVARFSAYGIERGRLIIDGWSSREDYLAAYGRVDIGLDPFPFTGGTTTAESLWMGVPVVTLAGQRFLSRQGVGLLMNAGLSDWVAESEADYCAKAISFAENLQELAVIRRGLREKVAASPIFDAERFAGYLEEALRGMWREWCLRNSYTSKQSPSLRKKNGFWRSLFRLSGN